MHYDFTTPLTENEAKKLRVNDTVTLRGTLFGIRDATQIHMFDRGRRTRFDLRGHAVLHTAPNVRKVEKSKAHPAGYAPICVGTTTSDRMERFTAPLMREYGVRLIIGKGGLRKDPRKHSRNSAARILQSSEARRPSRQPGSRRSRTSTSTTCIRSRYGSCASTAGLARRHGQPW